MHGIILNIPAKVTVTKFNTPDGQLRTWSGPHHIQPMYYAPSTPFSLYATGRSAERTRRMLLGGEWRSSRIRSRPRRTLSTGFCPHNLGSTYFCLFMSELPESVRNSPVWTISAACSSFAWYRIYGSRSRCLAFDLRRAHPTKPATMIAASKNVTTHVTMMIIFVA